MLYPLLDHDDFLKSRKALMATAAFVLLIHHLEIKGDTITVSGLTLSLNRDVLLGFASLFLLYFIYVFMLRAIEYILARSVESDAQLVEMLEKRQAVLEKMSPLQRAADPGHSEALAKRIIGRWGFHLRIVRIVLMMMVDLLPPFMFAVWVLATAGAMTAVTALIK